MALATHLGPWRLGTVKNTTGTTAGLLQNIGLTTVSQTKQVNYNTAPFGSATTTNLWVLPAGSQILQINVDTLTAFTGSTAANCVIGTAASTALFMASTDLTTAGRVANTAFAAKYSAWAGATSTAAPDGIGIGPLDIIVQAALTPTVANVTAGIVQYTVMYAVRNADGTGQTVAYNNA